MRTGLEDLPGGMGAKVKGANLDWGQGEFWKAGVSRGAGQAKAESFQAEEGA